MPRAVSDIGDLRVVGGPVESGGFRIEEGAEGFHDIEVRSFVESADIVGFTRAAALQNKPDGGGVVLDIEPVANLLPIAIDRERLAIEGVQNNERDELLRKMKGAVVVGAVCRESGEPVGVLEGADEVVAGGFGGGIGTVGGEGCRLGEGRVVRSESSVDFVGRDMQKAELFAAALRQLAPMAAGGIQKAKSACDIGLDEWLG